METFKFLGEKIIKKDNFYYRYLVKNKGVFEYVSKWIDLQTKKRYGKEWAKEYNLLSKRINKAIKWLPEYEEDKKIIYYFTEKGAKKYEKTLFKIHKEITCDNIYKKEFNLEIRKENGEFFVYDKKDKKRVGRLVNKDKFQIGVLKCS